MSNYWDNRAKEYILYKDELFYTISAVPYYYARRGVIIRMLKELMGKYKVQSLLDIGCGDGRYMSMLCSKGIRMYGVDSSKEMIERAKKKSPGGRFKVSCTGYIGAEQFDMVYIVAVMAHLQDEVVLNLLKNAYNHLSDGGVICLCEQVAPYYLDGNGWQRRTVEQYCNLLNKAGFKYFNKDYTGIIDFKYHRCIFERYIAKFFYKYYKMFYKDMTETDVRILSNHNKVFLCLSEFFTKVSSFSFSHKKSGWGYSFICMEK